MQYWTELTVKPKHIYIVDDDEEDQELFFQAVGDIDKNIKCETFSGCVEMISLLEKNLKNAPDFIFLDMNMPKINGRECLVRLKNDSRFTHIPVYIYSTTSFALEKEQALQLGAAGFIVKPSSLRTLKNQLLDILHSA